MKHPDETDLALYAGGELGLLARLRIGRHSARCARCRQEIARFEAVRKELAGTAGGMPPEVNWERLAAEMKANIHVGLAAGECVGAPAGQRIRFRWGAAAAAVPAALVLLAGWWLLPSRPWVARAPEPEGIVLEATAGGIELREGGGALSIQHRGSGEVTCTATAQGVLRARYVDAETGQVTINNVYAQ